MSLDYTISHMRHTAHTCTNDIYEMRRHKCLLLWVDSCQPTFHAVKWSDGEAGLKKNCVGELRKGEWEWRGVSMWGGGLSTEQACMGWTDSPWTAARFPNGMDPLICRACCAAGGIWRPVPEDTRRHTQSSYLTDHINRQTKTSSIVFPHLTHILSPYFLTSDSVMKY